MTQQSVERSDASRTRKGDQAFPPWKERALRGLALWGDPLGAQIEHQGHGKYTVPSCTQRGVAYTVDLGVFGGEESCNCPDRERPCKHLHAATIHRAKATAKRHREQEARRGERFSPEQVADNLSRMGA